MKITYTDPKGSTLPKHETYVFLLDDTTKLSGLAATADKKTSGAIAKAIKSSSFKGKKGQTLTLLAPHGAEADRIVLAGCGKADKLDALTAREIGGALVPELNKYGVKKALLFVETESKKGSVSAADVAANIGFGALLKSYRFDKYKTKEKKENKPTFAELSLSLKGSKDANKTFDRLKHVAGGMYFTRDLVTEPSNIINPESLAEECKKLSELGVTVQVLGEAQMQKLGMNALLGVGKGSAYESKLVVMRWNGAVKKGKSASQPLAFVGKGVTFDSGGISIKPSGGMEEMKWDMGGSATVIGLMHTLASRKAKVDAVGVVGLVENMPSSTAQKPGDVVKSASGQTIEVINTDAEGRLVLADALWYVQDKFKPKMIIDLATLTGAIIVGLGTSRAGLFSNNDELAERLFACGKSSGDEVWRLPLAEVYDKQIDSDIADMQNIGKQREAGSITAAQFLQRFINEGTPWAHLDIAGVAWSNKDLPTSPKGATAFGVALLDTLVAEHYEK